jgi:hypothetical protein
MRENWQKGSFTRDFERYIEEGFGNWTFLSCEERGRRVLWRPRHIIFHYSINAPRLRRHKLIARQNISANHRLRYSGQSEPPRLPIKSARRTVWPPTPYNPSATSDVLDIAVTKNLPTPVHLTACSPLSSDHLPIQIDTTCRSSFLNTPERPDFKRIDWSKFQACLDNVIPFNAKTADEAGIDACVGSLTSAISGALEVSTPKIRPRANPRPRIPTRIQDEIRLKNRLRWLWQLTRNPAFKAEINRLQRSVTLQLQEWKNDQWSDTLEPLHPEDQSLRRMTKRVMRVIPPRPPLVTSGGIVLSDTEKTEALADSLEAQFQPVADPSDPSGSRSMWLCERTLMSQQANPCWPTTRRFTCYLGSQIQQGPRPWRHPEQGPQASSPAYNPYTCGAFERDPQNAVFSSSMEARSSHLHSETGKGPGTTLFLSAHVFSRHDWQGFRKHST